MHKSAFNSVQDLALAGEPDEKLETALKKYAERLRVQLPGALTQCSAGQIGEMVVAIIDGIRFRRHQIQIGDKPER